MKKAFTRLSTLNCIPGRGIKKQMRRIFIVNAAIILFLGVGEVSGQVVIAEDNTTNYSTNWSGSGGFGFGAWNLYDDGANSGHFWATVLKMGMGTLTLEAKLLECLEMRMNFLMPKGQLLIGARMQFLAST